MANEVDSNEQYLHVDLDEQVEISVESPLAGVGWDTCCAIVARIPNSDPDLDDKEYDRIIFINPTLGGLKKLEDSNLIIKAMSFLVLTLDSSNFIPIKRISTWPTFNQEGEPQSIVVCESGAHYLITKDGPVPFKSSTLDWNGVGRYKFNNESKNT